LIFFSRACTFIKQVFEDLAILPNLGPEEMLKYRKGEAVIKR